MQASIEKSLSKVPQVTLMFWVVKVLATTLGETGGDAVSMSMNLGYLVGTAIFAVLFWSAFVLTRPLGAVVGDFLDKPIAKGGLELSRYTASAVLLVCIAACIVFVPQRAAAKAH